MEILFIKTRSKALKAFSKREWEKIHPLHYGKKMDGNYWNEKIFRFIAKEKGKIIATISGEVMAGVMRIEEMIISGNNRRLGVGKALMKEAEKFGKKNRVHIIYLETGITWEAVDFYKSQGFKIHTVLRSFYSKRDFVIMKKEL